MDAWVWILIVVVVIAVIAAVVATRSRQRENRRVEAADLRAPTADHHMERREKEAAAASSEAEARRVRAEADQRAAKAQHLEVQAQRAAMDRDTAAATSEEKLRRADALDPDVRTDSEGYRLDEQGNRIENPAADRDGSGFGAAAAAGAGGVAAGLGDHGHQADDVDEPTGGRIGNMRGLDDDVDGPGRSEEMRPEGTRPEERVHDERIGNMRGLDDDVTTRDDATDDLAADETTGEEPSLIDRAKGRVDDALGRRDTDDDGRPG
jgi:Tfp pilus assembly protein PilE